MFPGKSKDFKNPLNDSTASKHKVCSVQDRPLLSLYELSTFLYQQV